MAKFREFLEYVRSLFVGPLDNSRKRRASDTYDLDNYISPKKCLKLSPMAREFQDDWFSKKPSRFGKSSKSSRPIEFISLDDDDGKIKRPGIFRGLQTKSKLDRYTSTTAEVKTNLFGNGGGDDDDDVTFVKEIKSPKRGDARKFQSASYLRPFSSSYLDLAPNKNFGSSQNGTKPKDGPFNSYSSLRNGSSSRNFSSSSLDYSIRLDDKLQYKKLLECAGANSSSNNDSSIYHTPAGKLFKNDISSRTAKLLAMCDKSLAGAGDRKNTSSDEVKGKLRTKERIIKVLDEFEQEPLVVRDSDSESDVILCPSPPSPKPDIKVDPVNSLKTVVDTTEHSKTDWLQKTVENHRRAIEERQREINEYTQNADKHSKINRDIRLGLITSKLNRSLSIKDVVLPVVEVVEEVELPPLTNEQLKLVQRAFSGDPGEIMARKFNLNVSRRDLQTLAGLNWLNDEVINFYMNLIIERGKEDHLPKTYAFNTFFYSKLIKDGPQSLRRWTKRIDLFDHDLVCVPIHLGMHWCMAIIDFRDRSIRYYDSMGSSNNRCLDALRNYLEAEHLDKKKSRYDTSDFSLENVRDIPQQMNGSDCGMFSCTFAEFLSRDAKVTFSQEDMPYLRKKMVVEIITGSLLIQ